MVQPLASGVHELRNKSRYWLMSSQQIYFLVEFAENLTWSLLMMVKEGIDKGRGI